MKKPSNKPILKFMLKLSVLAIILATPIGLTSTFLHEQAHVNIAKQYNISMTANIFEFITPEPPGGQARPNTVEDCERFNSLQLEEKKEITHAGVKKELTFLLPLFLISLILLIIYYKKYKRRDLIFYILLSLVIVSFALMFNTIRLNVLSANPSNDWNKIFINCSGFV